MKLTILILILPLILFAQTEPYFIDISCSGESASELYKVQDSAVIITKEYDTLFTDSIFSCIPGTCVWTCDTTIDTIISVLMSQIYYYKSCVNFSFFDPNNSLYQFAIHNIKSSSNTYMTTDSIWGDTLVNPGNNYKINFIYHSLSFGGHDVYITGKKYGHPEISLRDTCTMVGPFSKTYCDTTTLAQETKEAIIGGWRWLTSEWDVGKTYDPGDYGYTKGVEFTQDSIYTMFNDTLIDAEESRIELREGFYCVIYANFPNWVLAHHKTPYQPYTWAMRHIKIIEPILYLLCYFKLFFVCAADWAYPVVRNICKSCSRGNSAVGISFFRVINIIAYYT